ncbi:minor capsid protein [Salinispora vitiensis]|uniref:minor capsid protein n=1 Tax=Salinispora vitiensis TaxID=999544 RepID=UPI00035E7FDA|nr:minor capsid protein [Salinispora vitiensis]
MAGFVGGVAHLLDAAGVGTYVPSGVPGKVWPIYLEHQPPQPGQCITVYGTGGAASPAGAPHWSEPTFTVRVRGSGDSRLSRVKCREVVAALHGLAYVELPDGIFVVDCQCQQSEPVHVGPDANGLHVHTAAFRASIEHPF